MKIGSFDLPEEYILEMHDERNMRVLRMIMPLMIVIDCRHDEGRKVFEYTAVSDRVFKDVGENEDVPNYEIKVSEDPDRKLKIEVLKCS